MSDKQYSDHDHRTELEKALASTKPWFESNATTLIYVLAAVLAAAAAIIYIQRQTPDESPGAKELMLASQPEEFRDVADAFPDSAIGAWARLNQADRLLGNAIGNMFTDRETGLEELDQAEAAYKQLANRTDVSSSIQERVLIGLARLTEARCDGSEESVNRSIDSWKKLLSQFEESMAKDYAEERIDRLSEEPTREFYTWFHAQNPSPDDPLEMPTDGPGSVPQIPDFPDLTIPSLDGSGPADISLPSGSSEADLPDDTQSDAADSSEGSEAADEDSPDSNGEESAPEDSTDSSTESDSEEATSEDPSEAADSATEPIDSTDEPENSDEGKSGE